MNNAPLKFEQKTTTNEWDTQSFTFMADKTPPHNNQPQRNWYLPPLLMLWIDIWIAAWLYYEPRPLKFEQKTTKIEWGMPSFAFLVGKYLHTTTNHIYITISAPS